MQRRTVLSEAFVQAFQMLERSCMHAKEDTSGLLLLSLRHPKTEHWDLVRPQASPLTALAIRLRAGNTATRELMSAEQALPSCQEKGGAP